MGFDEVSRETVSVHLQFISFSHCRLKGAPPLICPLNIQIFLINLKRRLDRRTRMLKTFAALGLQATLKDAVDGKYVAQTRD